MAKTISDLNWLLLRCYTRSIFIYVTKGKAQRISYSKIINSPIYCPTKNLNLAIPIDQEIKVEMESQLILKADELATQHTKIIFF